MTSLGAFKDPSAYHLLSYGTLLGSTLFQSFIAGVVAYRVLPRPQFSTLQKHTFPVYFTLQTVTPALLVLSYPRGPLALLPANFTHGTPNKIASILIGTMLATGLLNLLYVGPQTTKIMVLRKHQETRDGLRKDDNGFPGAFPSENKTQSKEMQALNRQFGILHGVSTLVNLVGFGAMIWYGGVLAERLRL
ncbi:hypothetical protein B0J11DRAFT_178194 [Dendryphion nanum]|uniref:TMEM205-like domain-containing protein n=1 Tax=Dendryphion nanum TaxID=256645 RepID=A0A9P9ED00_9PLEO|nr:hypothetical protein B0J11DRAFT_178194 [Dendryphion nanum]